MTDNIMEKFQFRVEDQKVTRIDGTDYADDFNCFGWLRGVRDRALMLECRMTNGNIISVAYSWLELAVLDLSDGITLTFGGRRSGSLAETSMRKCGLRLGSIQASLGTACRG